MGRPSRWPICLQSMLTPHLMHLHSTTGIVELRFYPLAEQAPTNRHPSLTIEPQRAKCKAIEATGRAQAEFRVCMLKLLYQDRH